jgi:hypothetical protein
MAPVAQDPVPAPHAQRRAIGDREDVPTCSCQRRTASEVSLPRGTRHPRHRSQVRGAAPTNYRGPFPFPLASTDMLSGSAANLACIAAGKAL